ncbi:hypothetical protein Q7A_03515 [Methylophaga nitratireducenticrescens]|nr:hypothetical protein Q7A_03515 [Methylophaga nitratireducenticrescens]AUZ84570.1 hypothetical protein CDW43_08255 [Methylophaga nitratireducenticrescens]
MNLSLLSINFPVSKKSFVSRKTGSMNSYRYVNENHYHYMIVCDRNSLRMVMKKQQNSMKIWQSLETRDNFLVKPQMSVNNLIGINQLGVRNSM